MDPIKVLRMVEEEPVRKEERGEKKKRSIESLLGVLGFKVLGER